MIHAQRRRCRNSNGAKIVDVKVHKPRVAGLFQTARGHVIGRFFRGGEKDDNKRIICEGAGLIRWSNGIFWVLGWCGSVWRSAIWEEGRGRDGENGEDGEDGEDGEG